MSYISFWEHGQSPTYFSVVTIAFHKVPSTPGGKVGTPGDPGAEAKLFRALPGPL